MGFLLRQSNGIIIDLDSVSFQNAMIALLQI